MNPLVSVVMGSKSDEPVMMRCIEVLEEIGVPFEVKVISAHRQPEKLKEYVESVEKDVLVIIAAAGMAAHLPGVIASYTTKPVIGVPISSGTLGGIDALLSIAQMPRGVPVATVAIDGAPNAAILACEIVALVNEAVRSKLISYRQRLAGSY